MAGVQPSLDGGAVVCDTGAQAYRGFHDVKGDRAPEEAGYWCAWIVFVLGHGQLEREIEREREQERRGGAESGLRRKRDGESAEE